MSTLKKIVINAGHYPTANADAVNAANTLLATTTAAAYEVANSTLAAAIIESDKAIAAMNANNTDETVAAAKAAATLTNIAKTNAATAKTTANAAAITAATIIVADTGTVSASGLQEADITKTLANLISTTLSGKGYGTLFIQDNIVSDICTIANAFQADAFVSIHCNTATDVSVSGMELFSVKGGIDSSKLASEIAIPLTASTLTASLKVSGVYTESDPTKEDSFYVLTNTTCLSVLIEVAYLSNVADALLLADQPTLVSIADSITTGVISYFTSLA